MFCAVEVEKFLPLFFSDADVVHSVTLTVIVVVIAICLIVINRQVRTSFLNFRISANEEKQPKIL